MTPPTLDPRHYTEWKRILNAARIGNVPKLTAKSVQALDAVEAYMSQMRDALAQALAELEAESFSVRRDNR